jgi:hypothetical protein
LPSAITAPRRSSGARHWISALSGTISKPPASPIAPRTSRDSAKRGSHSPKTSANSASAAAPSGSRPSSIFLAESLPASTLPSPMPIDSAISGKPTLRSGSASSIFP